MNRINRNEFARTLAGMRTAGAASYAKFITEPDASAGGRLPCWGAIAERYRAEFKTDEDRIRLWAALAQVGDPRPIFLFLRENEQRPAVMAEVAKSAPSLRPIVQRAIVCMQAAAQHIDGTARQALAPAARQLLEPEFASLLERERQTFDVIRSQLVTDRSPVSEVGHRGPSSGPASPEPAVGGEGTPPTTPADKPVTRRTKSTRRKR